MTNLATFRVCIAPIGFEIDRIVIPLKQTKADKLWILAHDNPSEDKSGPYLEKIKKECKKLGVEVKVAYSDRLSLFKTIKSIKEIISQEKARCIQSPLEFLDWMEWNTDTVPVEVQRSCFPSLNDIQKESRSPVSRLFCYDLLSVVE